MNRSKFIKVAGAVAGLGLVSSANAADYATVAAAQTAVEGIVATITPVFLAGATLGIGILILRLVLRMVKAGLRTK